MFGTILCLVILGITFESLFQSDANEGIAEIIADENDEMNNM